MNWWCRHQFAYPTLARLANENFAIPASSAASERIFSAAGNVVTKKRNIISWEMTLLSMPSCFRAVHTDWHHVKRNLVGGARQEGQVFFVFHVAAAVGFVSTYVHKLFRVALRGITYILFKLLTLGFY